MSRAVLSFMLDAVPAIATARQRARAELTAAIKAEARDQMRRGGAASLSLRAVARSLGMASSAVYRYYASRDELLTALIIDAYDAVGAAAEAVDGTFDREDITERFVAVGHAIRAWALDDPHAYALVYGSPVPGYQAPATTIGPASRPTMVLVAILRDAVAAGVAPPTPRMPAGLVGDAERIAAEVMPEVPPELVVRGLIMWTQLFGMISFELFGHLVGAIENYEAFFDGALRRMIAFTTA